MRRSNRQAFVLPLALALALAVVSPFAAFAGWRAEGPFEDNVNRPAFAPTRPIALASTQPKTIFVPSSNLDTVQFASLTRERGDAKVFYARSWSNDTAGGAVFESARLEKEAQRMVSGVTDPRGKALIRRTLTPGAKR